MKTTVIILSLALFAGANVFGQDMRTFSTGDYRTSTTKISESDLKNVDSILNNINGNKAVIKSLEVVKKSINNNVNLESQEKSKQLEVVESLLKSAKAGNEISTSDLSELSTKLNDNEDKTKVLALIDKVTGDEELKKKLEALKETAVNRNNIHLMQDMLKTITDEKVRSELKKIIADKLGYNPDAMKLSSDLSISPATGSNKLSPIISGNYSYREGFLKTQGINRLFWGYDVNLTINSNLNGSDSISTLNRIFRSGADGRLEVEPKIGVNISDRFKVLFAADGKLSWLAPKDVTDTTTTANFGYGSASAVVAFWFTPVVIALQRQWNFVSYDSTNFYSKNLHNSHSTNLLVGVDIGSNFQIQFKYLIQQSTQYKASENLEIKLGASFKIF